MDWLVIEGVRPWDGRYEWDPFGERPLTYREWEWITRYSGYMPLTIDDGYRGGDPRLYRVFAIVALYRAGKIDDRDVDDVHGRFADEAFGKTIRLEIGQEAEEEADVGPPSSRPDSKLNGSGDSSNATSGRSEHPPISSGTLASDTSESRLAGSAT